MRFDTHPHPFYCGIEVAPYREGLVVAVECIFTWYWLADLCAQEGIPFVLGHALYMKAIHGGKAKHDKIDSQKMAALLRGGRLPLGLPNFEVAPTLQIALAPTVRSRASIFQP